jgi:WD40 repeat protein/DNA-binding SARP family transcriptional activator
MPHLALSLLGHVHITVDGKPLTQFDSDKARAMLFFLSITSGQTHRRETIASLLWPEQGERLANQNLRKALHRLRQTLGDHANPTQPFLLVTPQSIAFNPDSSHTVDSVTFEALLALNDSHRHDQRETCSICLARLRQAVALYRGDLLAGFTFKDGAAFEEWLLIQRQRLHAQAVDALLLVGADCERRGDYGGAGESARQLLALEPWNELAHRQLMRALVYSNQRTAALTQYQTCCQILERELGIEPESVTRALYEQIKAGDFSKGVSANRNVNSLPEAPPSLLLDRGGKRLLAPVDTGQEKSKAPEAQAVDYLSSMAGWHFMPTPLGFYGRSAEMEQLKQWILDDRCQVVTLLGMGGIGKTTLAAQLTHQIAEQFDLVLWRSLLNAPPLSDILQNWLQILSRHTLSLLPERLEDQLDLLLDLLRTERCLLILDNAETILESTAQTRQPGTNDNGYDQLLKQIASTSHQSCLLVTSREQPQFLNTLRRTTSVVRSITLGGLEVSASQALLKTQGLILLPEQANVLAAHYSGNPLALQIVASTIVDWFSGDVTTFQSQGMPVFDNIRSVLDEQFIRLSSLERELIVWLAIEREAVTATTLGQDLIEKGTQRDFLDALRTLQRRSLLTRQGNGFTLQNVIIEYLTEWLIECVCTEFSTDFSAVDQILHATLNRHLLMKANAKEYVRQSQERLILQPIASRLMKKLGKRGLIERAQNLLQNLHLLRREQGETGLNHSISPLPGYAAGNILNLLLCAGIDVAGYDFSGLAVHHAYLRGRVVHGLNFANADLSGSLFTQPFSLILPVVYHPNNQWIAGGNQDGTIYLWRADNGQSVATYRGHSKFVYDLAFSADHRLLASASEDATVRIWNLETGKTLHLLCGHTTFVNSVAFSADGKVVASCSDDRSIRLWDVQSGRLLNVLIGHSDRVCQVAFANRWQGGEGRMVASCSDDQTVRLWDAETGALLRCLEGHTKRVVDLAFSFDDRLLASAGQDKTVCVWEVESGKLRHRLCNHETVVRAVAFHPRNNTLAIADGSLVSLWNGETGESLCLLPGHSNGVTDLAFSPDGQSLVSSSYDETVRMWDLQKGQPIQILVGYSGWIYALAYDSAGTLLATGIEGNQVRIWDVQTGKPHYHLSGHMKSIYAIAFSPDLRRLFSGGEDQRVYVWDLASGKRSLTLGNHPSWVSALAASHHGRWIATAAFDHTVRLWDIGEPQRESVDHDQLVHLLSGHSGRINSLVFSPDDTLLASGGEQNVYLWDVHHGTMLHHWTDHRLACMALTFSPDGRLLAGASEDHAIYLWDVCSGKLRSVLHGHSGSVLAIAFAPNGDTLASVGGDCTLCLWDVDRGTLQHRLTGHSSWTTAIAFHPDSSQIATGSAEGVVKLWDVQGGRCLATFTAKGPYAGMKISGVRGISQAQTAALRALGAS